MNSAVSGGGATAADADRDNTGEAATEPGRSAAGVSGSPRSGASLSYVDGVLGATGGRRGGGGPSMKLTVDGTVAGAS